MFELIFQNSNYVLTLKKKGGNNEADEINFPCLLTT